ncbi:MAG: hypothetical protein ACPGGK_00615 [Pikeienuella sp.]
MADDQLPFRADENALIKFGDPGTAPVLNYNIPQPAEYNGRHFLELEMPRSHWIGKAFSRDTLTTVNDFDDLQSGINAINDLVAERSAHTVISTEEVKNLFSELGDHPGVRFLREHLTDVTLANTVIEGSKVVARRDFSGSEKLVVVNTEPKPRPRLAIVTSVRMSSYLGDYGAAKTLSTFSLLPGETHEIAIKSFRRSKTTRSESSSILDSFEETTASEFGSDLTNESSSRSKESDSFQGSVSAKASASWGWGKASVSAKASTSSASEREEFAKSVENVTQKHAATAASKRNMEVNTSSEAEAEQTEERSLTRTIQNINVGRTLNFVFRQTVQRYITALYVTDVRIAFHNGDDSTYQEYSLAEIDDFLETRISVLARKGVKKAIHDTLFYNFDYKGVHRPLVEKVAFQTDGAESPLIDDPDAPESYWRFRQHRTQLDGVEDGANVTIPGSVLRIIHSTLPTDGVIVEALLGQGNALDAYSMGLQSEAVRAKVAENDLSAEEIAFEKSRRKAVQDKDTERAALITELYDLVEKGDGDE